MTHPKMQSISVGQDGAVWATDRNDGTIYRLYGDAGHIGWVPNTVGKARTISAKSWSEAWCVNEAGEIWRVSDANALDDDGNWQQVPTARPTADGGEAHSIEATASGTVYYCDRADNVYFGDVNGWKKWDDINAIQISARPKAVLWGIDKRRRALHVSSGSFKEPTGQGLAQIAQCISNGYDNSTYYSTTDGDLYVHNAQQDSWELMHSWDKGSMGIPISLAVFGAGDVWVVNSEGDVWRLLGTWSKIGAPPEPMLMSLEQFDHEYERLLTAVWENPAGGHHTDQLGALHQFCESAVSGLHEYLRSDQMTVPPEVKGQIAHMLKSWERYVEDAGQAEIAALSQLWHAGFAGGKHLDFTLLDAERLRGHFKYLRQFISMQSNLTIEDYTTLPTGVG